MNAPRREELPPALRHHAEALMAAAPQPPAWNHATGCMATALLALHAATGEGCYLQFCDDYLGGQIEEDGAIPALAGKARSLEDIGPGSSLFALHARTGRAKYRKAMDTLRARLVAMPRTSAGNFAQSESAPGQLWLAGLYMAQPFYLRYETMYNGMGGCRDSFLQLESAAGLTRLENGLYCQAWDESKKAPWADAATGRSAQCRLEALGWFAAALADTIDATDEQLYYERRTLQATLRRLMDALLPWQRADGTFCRVVDAPEAGDNAPEPRGTALAAYAILKAVRLGLLPGKYRPFGEKAFWGAAQAGAGDAEDPAPLLLAGAELLRH